MTGFLSLKIDDVKGAFFDSKRVEDSVSKVERANLSKAGAFIRRSAIFSIRSGKGSSKPGQPPKSHSGILKRFLYFAFDSSSRSVVVGPALTNQTIANQRAIGNTIPGVLESGGQEALSEVQSPRTGQWWKRNSKLRFQQDWPQRTRRINVAARPFMAPALQANIAKIPGVWKDSVH